MKEVKPTFQHGYGFEQGENVFSLPNGIEFDSRQPNAKKGIKGSTKEEWDALHKQFPNLIRKQGEDYTKLKVDALQRLIAKRQVRLKKGESIKELKKDQLVIVLQEWEVFKR
jgi:hypothetical protein